MEMSSRTLACACDVAGEVVGESPEETDGESQSGKLISDMEELHAFRALLVCGKLKGEHPPGFLSRLRDLPNEIILKIWSYLSKKQLRTFRQVSKHWKALWESTKQPKFHLDSMSISVEDGKFVIKARSFGLGRKVEVEMNAASLQQAFSLVTFESESVDEYRWNTLILEGAAANSMVLECITSNGWAFHSVVFEGDLRSLTEVDLGLFLSSSCANCARGISLRFMDVIVNEGVITDRVIEACDDKLNELVIILHPDCVDKKPVLLTERSLPLIVKEGLVSIIPDVAGFTIRSLKKAISDMFVGVVPTAVHRNEFGELCSNSMLAFPASSGFSMENLSQMRIKIPNYKINKTHYARGFTDCEKGKIVNRREFAKLKGGMIEFMCDSDWESRAYTIDIADPERINDLRGRFAIAKIDVSESHMHQAYSCDTSLFGGDFDGALSDRSADYYGFHTDWSDYDGDVYDEMNEIDYDDYMGV
ncbi:hypothetical protein Tcan_02787 [Toxocara canis]|uniref:F-box domain-containing protein n=2 Tax=Toxocara canis TaxID=6265 RepID=A0A0B2V4M8_TOXCA|nr:hypothetical protein Tcan_02787 [Toxocara canis]VDM37765.1 unnamed protein product [Toxocara canis]